MKLFIVFALLASVSANAAEVKNLGPENVSLSKKLLMLLGPQEESKVPTHVDKERQLDLSLAGGTTRLMNLKVTDSHITTR